MSDIVNSVWEQFGPLGLFVLAVSYGFYMFSKGKWVQSRFYDDVVAQRDTAIRAAQVSAEQVKKLTDNDATIIALLQSVERQAMKAQEGGMGHV
jgi:uncharacterized protein HemX